MSKYLIGGAVIEKSDPSFDSILKKAHQAKERPLCLCKQTGILMYIAKLSSTNEYLIKRMPNSGQSHSPGCESFEIPPELSGRGAVDNKAISEDLSTGLTSLKLDFSLSKASANRTMSGGEPSEQSSIKTDPPKLSIRSVLHCLYEDAGLNKWSPKMEGKRTWYVIRKNLMEAAQNKVVRNNPLVDILLIPESFSIDKKSEIEARQRQFLSKLKPVRNKSPMGLLIGEVKSFENARFGKKLIVKHMPGTPIYFGDDLDKRLRKKFSTELTMHEQNEDMHLIVIATFLISASGNPSIDSMSFMMVDKNWLPYESLDDLDAVAKAVDHNRYFIKGLRYNLPSTDVIATLLLSDTNPMPTALYVVPHEVDEQYYANLETVIDGSEFDSCVWDLNKDDTLSLPSKMKSTQTRNNGPAINTPVNEYAAISEDDTPNVPDYLNDVPPYPGEV